MVWLTARAVDPAVSGDVATRPVLRAAALAGSTCSVTLPCSVPAAEPTMRNQLADGAATFHVQSAEGGVTVKV
jgi:hypothetical protein